MVMEDNTPQELRRELIKSNLMRTRSNRSGLTWGFISYVLWGVFPLYWKLLEDRSPFEILFHRMLWSFVFYLFLFLIFKHKQIINSFRKTKWDGIFSLFRQIRRDKIFSLFKQTRRDWIFSFLAAIILAFNWGLYIYAVNSGHVLESSLAYFINPILNVIVGVVFFKESFPPILRWAVVLAAIGVLLKIFLTSGASWISLTLAVTFCIYGVIKKLIKIPALSSSVLEGVVGFLPAVIGVIYFLHEGEVLITPKIWFLFVFSGAVTGLPLFLFSYSAQRVPYSIMGMLQFIAPTLQFLVGIGVYHEAFGLRDLISYGFIWMSGGLYLTYQILKKQRSVSWRGAE